MNTSSKPPLELHIGERYLYRVEIYEITSIEGNKIQLRSLSNRKNIAFKSYAKLVIAHKQGLFLKVQEAPLAAESNRLISALTQEQRAELNKRLTYVQTALERLSYALPRQKAEELIKEISQKLNDPRPPCYTTLYNWKRDYLRAGQSPIALIRARLKVRRYRIHRQPIEIRDIVDYNLELLYFSRTHATIGEVVDAILYGIDDLNSKRPAHALLTKPSESTLRRIIRELDTFEVQKSQLGFRRAIKAQQWSQNIPEPRCLLERVECDTHQLDITIVSIYGEVLGKPYLTVVLEVYSRRIIGWDISLNPPSIEKTIRALKKSISSDHERNGLALLYILDNGPEFIAKKLKDCLYLLGAEVIFCEPYEPNQKAHVERWFRTLETQIIHHMKGTTFSNIQEREDYDSEGEAIFKLEQVLELFGDWLETVYHSDFHSSINTSPNNRWDSGIDSLFPPKRHSNSDLKRIFLSTATVTPHNGRVTHNKLSWTGPSVAYLSTLNKKKQRLLLHYDVSELGCAWISHPDFPDEKFQIEAVNPDYQAGLTMHMHELVLADMSKQKRAFNFKEARDNRVRINLQLANAKGKRTRKQLERLAETERMALANQLKDSSEATPQSCPIDPSRHITDSHTPTLSEVLEASHANDSRKDKKL